MAANGRLPRSALSPIPGGRLSRGAALAWNAGPARAGLRPSGPDASYRPYARQVYYWQLYLSGRGNLAARPGTSNHGLGNAVDLAAPPMRAWIDANGARYGWRKIEAFSEWWHVNYVGWKRPDPLAALGRRGRAVALRLLYHRREMVDAKRRGQTKRFARNLRWARFYRRRIERALRSASGVRRTVLARVLAARSGRL